MSVKKEAGGIRSLGRLLPYLNRYQPALIFGTITVLCTNVAAVIVPWILKNAIDYLQEDQITRQGLLFFALLLVGITAVEGAFRFLMRRTLIGLSRDLEFDLRNDVFSHLQTLSARFYQKYPTGDLMARCTNDLAAVRSVLGPGIMYSINTIFSTVLAVGFLVAISPRLAVLTLLPLLAVSLSVKYWGRLIHERFEYIQEQFSWVTTLVQENLAGIRVVKAYNQEKAFIDRFQEANLEYLNRSMALVRIQGIFQPLLAFLLGLSSVALLWYGGRLVIQGNITLGEFVAFLAYLAMLTWPMIALGFVINIFERGSASMGRINQILDTSPEIHDENAVEAPVEGNSLEVRNLTFSYNGTQVLSEISFRIEPGSTVAIVGRTGSGKSTIAQLLCRLYPVEDGSIFIGNRDINQIPVKELRARIGYVPQDSFLFSETVRQNIAFGKPSASLAEVREAAQISNILPDIEDFPDNFDTRVGERGITLSGGQKQRMCISRALLIDPQILILDDSLSAVDTHTEEQILQRLSVELADRTAVLISHRVSTVKMADQILVIDNGRIVERGRHDELLRQDGYYSELYQRQLLKEELDIE